MIYAAQGFERFHPLTGYLGEMVESFVGEAEWPAGVEVECVETGIDTPTGGRLKLALDGPQIAGGAGRRFCATYADGVADIDLDALLDCVPRQFVAEGMEVAS